MTLRSVESTSETVRSGFLDPSARPVATVRSGHIVSYPNTWTHWGNEAVFGMTLPRESLSATATRTGLTRWSGRSWSTTPNQVT